jgi:hypothetical protein
MRRLHLGCRGGEKGKTAMQRKKLAVLAVAAMAASALGLGGCATEDYVNKHVAEVDSHVADVGSKAEATQTQVD